MSKIDRLFRRGLLQLPRLGLIFISLLMSTLPVHGQGRAPARLLILKEGVTAYSGPSRTFRALATLAPESGLPASKTLVQGAAGESFYRVVVTPEGGKRKVIGYVPVSEEVRLIPGDVDITTEELERYGDVALIARAAQISASFLKDNEQFYSAGYSHYIRPGFFVKGFIGQYRTPFAAAFVSGGEIGNDALLFGPLSGFISYGAGIAFPPREGRIFEASEKANALLVAAIGLRLTHRGRFSVSAGATQLSLFNQNNSHLSSGLNITLEMGL